jgi:hypothetical protein
MYIGPKIKDIYRRKKKLHIATKKRIRKQILTHSRLFERLKISPCRKLSNDVSHATCTLWNRVDSRLLVAKNQIANLTLDPSFGHNLCFRCPNGQCEPILDIYILRAFQLYNEFFNPLSLAPTIALWAFRSPSGLQLPKWKFPWECECLFPHTLLHSREHATWLPGFPFDLKPCNPLSWSQTQG